MVSVSDFRRNYVFISICFVFVFGLALCILFDGVVDVVLFCCMFRFLLFSSLVLLQVATLDCSWYG